MSRFSDEEIERYARQMVLPEVGGVGQARLRSTAARARSEVEALYLAGAGVGRLTVPTAAIAAAARALNPLATVEVDGALADDDVETGALAALATLKQVLAL
jgi:molybdopterin/thiamine biosynthesis adenylyltransferase